MAAALCSMTAAVTWCHDSSSHLVPWQQQSLGAMAAALCMSTAAAVTWCHGSSTVYVNGSSAPQHGSSSSSRQQDTLTSSAM